MNGNANNAHNKAHMREWAVYCGAFLSTLDTGIVTLALKPIATVFDASLPVVGLIVTFYLFALIAAIIPSGWLGDRFGCERVLAVGFAVFGGASVLCASSSTIIQLILGRVLQGVGAALIQANAAGYVARQPPDRRLHMSTLLTTATGIGPIVGPLLGGLLMDLGSWPWLFLINIPFCIAGFFISWHGHQVTPEHSSNQRDRKGLSLFALLLALAALLLYLVNTEARFQNIVFVVLLLSATSICFARHEWCHKSPFIPVAVLVRRTPAFLVTASCALGYTAGVFFTAAPIVLLYEHENAMSLIGIIISAAPVGLIVGAFIRRHLLIRLGELEAMQVGSVMMISAFVLFAAPMTVTRSTLFAACAALFGIGCGLFQVFSVNNVFRITPERPSMAGALQRLFRNFGTALGATVALYVLHHGIESQIPALSRTSLLFGSTAIVLFALLCLSAFQDARHYHS